MGLAGACCWLLSALRAGGWKLTQIAFKADWEMARRAVDPMACGIRFLERVLRVLQCFAFALAAAVLPRWSAP
jgi:hypothetical protein